MPIAPIGFYSAALVCAAVPQIGCGCLAKPVLAQLEDQPAIARAWLHRRGDLIAIEWRCELDVDQQVRLLHVALGGGREFACTPAAAGDLLATFPDPSQWYRCETVDQLSEEEAHTIAARIVLRLSQRGVPLPDGAALQCDLACALRDVLIADENIRIEARLARLLAAARDVLQQHVGVPWETVLTLATLLPADAAPCEHGA
ncbi:hypothetical protein [Pseudoxanthomonas sp. SE1]|uniref:hypothetical protein n=1 Tax=Pseudoxanthomonas sp. SE1 TaxID=1664560 RepID=UPI00240D731E|nr:hypothetical protein [Pseudoxanthomonas sp. SE1]WFC40264.1 hypothetical protein OY559_10390 [Pseudoxanthomonas sp. SE1]WFC43733.1 hypothetical protein OY559_09660 [Pseudoxanthomonas sp. SE1]